MPRWRVLSGQDIIRILAGFGFQQVSQRGSHVKVQRKVEGIRQSLTVPLHNELDRGTLHAIFRQSVRFVSEAELKPHFQTDERGR